MAEFINLLVYIGVFFNIHVLLGDISFGLVIIIITYKVFHRIFGQELFHFGVKLGSQSFIVADYQGGAVYSGNYICHGKSFTGAGNPQQGLVCKALCQPLREFFYRLGLITGKCKIRDYFEIRHIKIINVWGDRGNQGRSLIVEIVKRQFYPFFQRQAGDIFQTGNSFGGFACRVSQGGQGG
ncbi:MAG: hypothetical protein EGMGGAKC_00719 [Dehalococcoides mccartyi]|nr:hypothetical protein [Dehalococcoides mccartyi]